MHKDLTCSDTIVNTLLEYYRNIYCKDIIEEWIPSLDSPISMR